MRQIAFESFQKRNHLKTLMGYHSFSTLKQLGPVSAMRKPTRASKRSFSVIFHLQTFFDIYRTNHVHLKDSSFSPRLAKYPKVNKIYCRKF